MIGLARRLALGALLCAFLAATGPAVAQTPPTLAQDQARSAFNLYLQGCVTRVGEAEAQRRWAREGRLKPATDAARYLKGKPGQAWLGPDSLGLFVLVSFDDGACQVWAQRADIDALALSMDKLARGPGRPGTDVVKEIDQMDPTGGGNIARALGYRLSAPGRDITLRLVGGTRSEADFQAILTAHDTKK
jgi:hypothetical protein